MPNPESNNAASNAPALPVRRGPLGGGPMGPAMQMVEKPKDFKGTMLTLIKFLKPFWSSIVLVFGFAIVSTVFSIASPKILGNTTNDIVDSYIQGKAYDQILSQLPAGVKLPAGTTGSAFLDKMPAEAKSKLTSAQIEAISNLDLTTRPQIDFSGIAKTIWFLIGLYLISALFSYIQGWIMAGVAQKATLNLRRDFAEKIGRLPLKYFDGRTYGEVLSRVTNDVDTVGQTLNQSLSQIVTSITTIIGILVMMLTISWQLTLVALLVLPLSFSFVSVIIKKSQRYFSRQQASLGKLNGHVEEMFSGHTIMRVYNGERRSVAEFRGVNNSLYDSAWKSQFLSGLMMPIMMLVGNIGYVGVAVLGGWLVVKGKLKIGDIQAFIQYMNQFTQPITQTASIFNVLQSTAAAAERVFEFLREEEEVRDVETRPALTDVKGAVEFKQVKFSYEPGKPIIKDFNAKILPGQRVAIVGPTGAGKTTLVNLLMRFYEVDSGAITIDGVNIRDLKRSEVRSLFGMVLQDTWLFNGTVEANIAYGMPKTTLAQVEAAAEAAHADHFIKALPGSYKMVLNEEVDNISQGEKQLLTIARAMLANKPMLILDEATSSVDTRTEVLIQKAMEKLMKGKTSFVIAHRLSTIKNADLILVLKEGNIIEQGNHQALLKQGGFYASLYNSQFAGVAEES